VYIILLD
jgi:hypothetical protein